MIPKGSEMRPWRDLILGNVSRAFDDNKITEPLTKVLRVQLDEMMMKEGGGEG